MIRGASVPVAPLRPLLLVAGAQTLLCLAVLDYVRRTFAISPWLLAVHLPLVIALIAVSLAPAGLFLRSPRLRDNRAAPYLFATVPALALTLLLTLYAADFAANLWLDVNVTHKLAALWVTDWWRGGQMLSLPPSALWLAAGAFSAVFAIQLLVWGRALGAAGRSDTGITWRPLALAAATAIAVAYGVFFYQLSWRTPRSELLSADPILAFIRATGTVTDERQIAIFERLRREEPLCRAAYPRDRPFDRKHVILIMVDSLRADHMQVYGYSRQNTPFLAGLLETGRLKKVEFATSICAESNCGIIGTLFSKTLRHQVPENFKLYDLLRDQGYDTNFILAGNHDWQGLQEMYGNEPTFYLDGRDSVDYGWSDDRVIQEGLARIPDARAPAFFFVHLMSVHLLGEKQEQYRVYQPSAVKNDWEALFSGEYDRESVTNNYDNGVLQADATIKELFATLDRKGYLENSVVMILSDHGEGLGDRGPANFGHVTSLYQEFIRIPFLIYDDPTATYANLRFATQLDAAPTIVDRLGLPVPPCWEGTSLARGESPPVTFHQTALERPCFAVIDHSAGRLLKYMQCTAGRREELYDLGTDPGERNNLAPTADQALLDRFRTLLQQWREQ